VLCGHGVAFVVIGGFAAEVRGSKAFQSRSEPQGMGLTDEPRWES
jgi:hypothetical protein